jgi:putative DNA primase/helicase
LILQGAGENGKSALTTDGFVPALGSYASMASSKLFRSTKGSEHSTEMADLRGRRLLIAEELTEGRSIDVAALKRITDVGTIKARYIRQDNLEFKSTHSLMVTTNYIPVINETDRGVASTPATTLPVHLPQGE